MIEKKTIHSFWVSTLFSVAKWLWVWLKAGLISPCSDPLGAQVRKMPWQHIVMDQDMPAQHFGRYGHSMMQAPGWPILKAIFFLFSFRWGEGFISVSGEICLAGTFFSNNLELICWKYISHCFFLFRFLPCCIFGCVWWQSDSYEFFLIEVMHRVCPSVWLKPSNGIWKLVQGPCFKEHCKKAAHRHVLESHREQIFVLMVGS